MSAIHIRDFFRLIMIPTSILSIGPAAVDGRRGGTARSEFLAKFRPLLHPSLTEVVMVHSGSQANGLAIQLARAKTGATDVIVFEHSFHGSLSESSACSTVLKETQEPWVHALPIPDLYRGPHRGKTKTRAPNTSRRRGQSSRLAWSTGPRLPPC